MDATQRQTAYRIWLADLIKGEFIKSSGEFQPNFVLTRNLNISRVNIVGAIVFKNIQGGFGSLSIDDGSAIIQVRAWKEGAKALEGFDVGSLVNLVGKVKNFNNKIYLVPEFLRRIENPAWFKLRKIELRRLFGEVERIESKNEDEAVIAPLDLEDEDIGFVAVQEEKVSDAVAGVGSKRQALLSLIEEEDKNDGADISVVISKSGFDEKEAQAIIDDLIREGEVFQLNAGRVRTLL